MVSVQACGDRRSAGQRAPGEAEAMEQLSGLSGEVRAVLASLKRARNAIPPTVRGRHPMACLAMGARFGCRGRWSRLTGWCGCCWKRTGNRWPPRRSRMNSADMRHQASDLPSCAAPIASATHSTAGRRFVERMRIVSSACRQQRRSRLALLDAALIAALRRSGAVLRRRSAMSCSRRCTSQCQSLRSLGGGRRQRME